MFKKLATSLAGWLTKIWPYLSRVFDKTDAASFGRFASFICLLFVLGWNTFYIYTAMKRVSAGTALVRDILPEPGQWMAETGFMLAFYTASKGLDQVGNKKDNQ